jgi:hypothetical protein
VAVYYVYSGAGGSGNGTSWANAAVTLTAGFVLEAAGDTLYVAHDHSESTGTAITLTSSGTVGNPSKIICVNRSGSVPPVSADRRATAQVATTGSSTINLNGFAHYDGIIFLAGSSTGSANINIPSSGSGVWVRLDNCSLRINGTGGGKIGIGSVTGTANSTRVELNNTTVSFSGTSQTIVIGGWLIWRNTPSALLGTMPTTLFTPISSTGGALECVGVDLSAAGSGKTVVSGSVSATSVTSKFIDCKLDAAVTKSSSPTSSGAIEIDFIRSGSSGVNYTIYSDRTPGRLTEETTIVRTGGASDGTTPLAWKIVTTATCTYSLAFECPPIAIWNDTTGSAKTATVEGIWGGGAAPLDDEIWIDVEYLGDASSPQGSFVNDGKADLLTTAANQTSSSETWGGSTTKFKLAVTFTAQQKGWVYARVKCAKASSTFYVDPLITLT